MHSVPESAEVRREAMEREAITAMLWDLWQGDADNDDLKFHSPADLCCWVARRLVADAERVGGEPPDRDVRLIAEGVARLVGRRLGI